MFLAELVRGLAVERRNTGEEFEQHAAEGVQVGRLGHRRGEELLGGHVAGGADRDTRARHLAVLDVVEDPPHAEVEDLDHSTAQQHDVGGLEIAVNDTGGVRRGQPVRDLSAQRRDPADGQLRMLAHQVSQGLPVEKLHRDVGQTGAVHPAVDDAREVAVVEPAHDAHLAFEPLDRLGVGVRVDDRTGAAAQDQLHRDHAIPVVFGRLEVLGAVDLPHVALTHGSQETEPACHLLEVHRTSRSPRTRRRERGPATTDKPLCCK